MNNIYLIHAEVDTSQHTLLSWWSLLILVLCGAALPAMAHITSESMSVNAHWIGLERRDAEIAVSKPVLYVNLENREGSLLRTTVDASVMIDGKQRRLNHRSVLLPPYGMKRVRFPLSLQPSKLREQRFSGRVKLVLHLQQLDLQRHHDNDRISHDDDHLATDSLALPELWFHANGRKLLIYREDVLRERYAGGNYRGLELATVDFEEELRIALREAELSSIQPVLSHLNWAVPSPGFNPDDVIPVGARKFCLVMDGIAYQDSSRNWKDFGEDIGRAGSFIPLSRGWVAIGQGGSPLYSGFLDAGGCSPYLISSPNEQVSVAFSPIYLNQSNNIRGFIADLNLGPQWPDSMPLQLLYFDPVDAPINYLEMDQEDYIHTMFAAAANCMERAPGGMSDVLYEFQLRLQGDNNGTLTNYAPEGHARVQVKFSAAATSKFTLCHEYAHAINLAQLQPPLPLDPTGLDYSVNNNEPEQHTLTSKEWNLAAAIEGFGNFVSATVWNDVFTGANAVYVAGGTTPQTNSAFTLHTFDQRFLNNFGAPGNPGQGVELDWSQFFWAWITDNEPGAPTLPVLVDIWYEAYPWPVNQGFYPVYLTAADTLLNSASKLARMEELRIDAGIVP